MDAVRVNLILVPRAYALLVSGWITRAIILKFLELWGPECVNLVPRVFVPYCARLKKRKGNEDSGYELDWVRVVVRVKKRLRV